MVQTPVTADLSRLRVMAKRVERSAEELAGVGFPGLDPDELCGSAVGGVASPTLMAARLREVVGDVHRWARAAHIWASALENADRDHAQRM